MSRCRPEQRQRATAAAAELEDVRHVVGVDVLEPTTGPLDSWTVAAVLSDRAGGFGPAAAAVAAEHGLTVRAVEPRGGGWRAVLVFGRGRP